MTLLYSIFISCELLYMFRVKHSPIIRSSIKLYLQHLVLTDRVWPAVIHDARNDEHKIHNMLCTVNICILFPQAAVNISDYGRLIIDRVRV
jgi:hypothetical protein